MNRAYINEKGGRDERPPLFVYTLDYARLNRPPRGEDWLHEMQLPPRRTRTQRTSS